MVRIGDADVRRRVRGNIGQHIPVNLIVIRVQPHRDRDVGIQLLKVRDCFLVDLRLGLVGVILRPENDLHRSGFIKAFRDGKALPADLPVAGGQQQQGGQQQAEPSDSSSDSHPLVPPLDTPAMIFFRKTRNRAISGRLMTTTAAIIAGVFSRPKPLSRSC